MRLFIYWALTASTLFLVSCSEESDLLYAPSGSGEDIEEYVYRFGGTGDDRIHDVIKVDDGLVIVGQSNSVDGDFEGVNNGDARYDDWGNAFIMKISLKKELEWVSIYGSGEEDPYSSFDHVFENGDGYTVFGRSDSATGDFEGVSFLKAELDSSGEVVSVTAILENLEYPFNTSGYNFLEKVDGCCYLALPFGDNVSFLYMDENLNLRLSRWYEGNVDLGLWDWGVAGLSLPDGFLITGNAQSNQGVFEGLNNGLLINSHMEYDLNSRTTNVFLMKTDNGGEIEWLQTYGGRERDQVIALTKGHSNNYIIAGNNQTNDGDFEGYGGEFQRDIHQIFMISIDDSGETEWIKTFGGSEKDYLEIMITTSDGGFLLSGISSSTDGDFLNSGNGDRFLMKVDQNGEKEWAKKFRVPDVPRPDGAIVPSDTFYQHKAIFSLQDSYLMVLKGKEIVLIEVDQNGNFIE